MTKTEFMHMHMLRDSYQDDANVATLIEIIFDYGQGEEDDDPSDRYIRRLVATIDFDWGTDASRDIYNMINQVYPYIEFPESLV